jgi:hypothetical protein
VIRFSIQLFVRPEKFKTVSAVHVWRWVLTADLQICLDRGVQDRRVSCVACIGRVDLVEGCSNSPELAWKARGGGLDFCDRSSPQGRRRFGRRWVGQWRRPMVLEAKGMATKIHWKRRLGLRPGLFRDERKRETVLFTRLVSNDVARL